MRSIKIDDEIKEKLDRFLAKIFLEKKGKVSQKKLLAMMIDFAIARKDDFLKELEETLPPLEDDSMWKLLETPVHWGIKDSSKSIDKYLYEE